MAATTIEGALASKWVVGAGPAQQRHRQGVHRSAGAATISLSRPSRTSPSVPAESSIAVVSDSAADGQIEHQARYSNWTPEVDEEVKRLWDAGNTLIAPRPVDWAGIGLH